jgi:anhydro-N-acetylmuramic acid kinase
LLNGINQLFVNEKYKYSMKKHAVVGLMSGTSLDGLDIAFATFHFDSSWHFKLSKCTTVPYDELWRQKLQDSIKLGGLALKKLDLEYGKWLGAEVNNFLKTYNLKPDMIVSHGHTVFHQPGSALTMQIGDGHQIFAKTGITTIVDFRSTDVALGGQGAPLVPLGDYLLFPEYDYCLNIGGFSNISYRKNNQPVAYDICPANIVLNWLAKRLGLPFDDDGRNARAGILLPNLLKKLNNLRFYGSSPPKSLGREWIESNILPLLLNADENDLLHTFCHHVADQISRSITNSNPKGHIQKVLVSGGGAKNSFLMDLIRERCKRKCLIVVPEENILSFKEALIFAFLGLLRCLGKTNTIRSVTGAREDSSGGTIIGPLPKF